MDIQLHGGSNLLLNIEGRIPRSTIHLLYCGLQIDNNPGNHYDALLPISPNNNPQRINEAANTQTNVSGDIENDIFTSQSTLISDPDSASTSSSSSESNVYTEILLSKYVDHSIMLPYRKKILTFLNKQNQTTTVFKKRKMCKLCFCRFRALHLHGKSKNSKILCQFLQSIRAQLLPLQLSSVIDPTGTQTSISPTN